jgi:hypothetical protein
MMMGPAGHRTKNNVLAKASGNLPKTETESHFTVMIFFFFALDVFLLDCNGT